MILRLRFYLLGLAPLLLALFVWDLDLELDSDTNLQANMASWPEAIVDNPRITAFGEDGRVLQRFTGETLVSITGGRWLEISKPLFDIAAPTGDFWQLRSDRGYYDQTLGSFRLAGDVHMFRTTGFVPVNLYTQELEIDMRHNLVLSQSAVSIESPGHSVSGIGLVADLKNSRFELLSQVRARHEAP